MRPIRAIIRAGRRIKASPGNLLCDDETPEAGLAAAGAPEEFGAAQPRARGICYSRGLEEEDGQAGVRGSRTIARADSLGSGGSFWGWSGFCFLALVGL